MENEQARPGQIPEVETVTATEHPAPAPRHQTGVPVHTDLHAGRLERWSLAHYDWDTEE